MVEQAIEFELPEECWGLVFTYFTKASQWEAISLTCRRFLLLSNRLRPSISISCTCTHLPGGLPRILQRFQGLRAIDLSSFHGNLGRPLLAIAQSAPRLQSLCLQGQKGLHLEAIRILGHCCGRYLRRLNCAKFQVWQDSDLVAIAAAFPSLEELDMSYPQHGFRSRPSYALDPTLSSGILTDAGVEAMAAMLVNLRSLNISGHYMLSDVSMEALALGCRDLTDLTVFDCPYVTDRGLSYLASHCRKLGMLAVNGAQVTPLGIEGVISSTKGLFSLNLSHTIVTDEVLGRLAESGLPLKKLVLACCKGLTSSGLLKLAKGCPHLMHLDLEGAHCLRDEDTVIMVNSFPNLVFLRLNYCSMLTDMSFFYVLHNCVHLEQLDMEGTGLGWVTACLRSPQPRFQIQRLKVAWNKPVGDMTLQWIGRLCPSLVSLDVSHCLLVTDNGLTAVGKGCSHLRELYLKGCKKVHSLGAPGGFKYLEHLELEASGFTDMGLATLSKSCRSVVSLGLEGCVKVTDVGLKQVMEECKGLKHLCLRDCQGITNDALAWMVFCRPSLRKLVLPSSGISDGQKARLTRHGCELVKSKAP